MTLPVKSWKLEANEKFAISEGMRGPMYGEAMTTMMQDLQRDRSRLSHYESKLPKGLREQLGKEEFRRSCEIWFVVRVQGEISQRTTGPNLSVKAGFFRKTKVFMEKYI